MSIKLISPKEIKGLKPSADTKPKLFKHYVGRIYPENTSGIHACHTLILQLEHAKTKYNNQK